MSGHGADAEGLLRHASLMPSLSCKGHPDVGRRFALVCRTAGLQSYSVKRSLNAYPLPRRCDAVAAQGSGRDGCR
eukprot:1226564-Prymnesium_polylepis.2